MSESPNQYGINENSAIGNASLDVSSLPTYGYSHRSLMWWGTWGMMLIEGTAFLLAIGCYLYLYSHSETWPMSRYAPDLLWGTINLIIMLTSALPNHLVKDAAEREDLPAVRLWLVICLVFSLVFLGIRIFEFQHLNVHWTSNAYGSVVWLLLGLHTVHLLTDAIDSAVLTTLMFTGPIEGTRFVDVSENALYWYFVVFTWIPIYIVLYLLPRML